MGGFSNVIFRALGKAPYWHPTIPEDWSELYEGWSELADDEDLAALGRRLTEYKIEVIEQTADRMIIRDPFGMMLELWPRSVLRGMGLL